MLQVIGREGVNNHHNLTFIDKGNLNFDFNREIKQTFSATYNVAQLVRNKFLQ